MRYPTTDQSQQPSLLSGIALAILSVATVIAARLIGSSYVGGMSPFLSMALAVLVSAWFGGVASGTLAAALSTLATAYFFLQPVYSFKLLRPEGVVELAIFLVESTAIVIICKALRASRGKRQQELLVHEDTKQRLDAADAERSRITLDLHDRDTLLKLITNSLPVAIAYLDAEERYRFCNNEYAQWHGMSRDEIIGKSERDVVGAEIYMLMADAQHQVMAGRSTDVEAQLPYKDKTRYVRIHKVPDVQEDGTVTGFVTLAADLSDQRRHQDDLIQAKEAADAANQAKTSFLANMSHEIRTPLGAILGFSELLIGTSQSASDRVNWVAAIKRNSELLSAIINDILDISKVEAGKIDVEHYDVPLSEVLTDITTLLNLRAQEKGIRLTVTYDGIVPSYIKTDPLRLRQILLNVVGNAIKFTPKGFVDVKLKLLSSAEGATRLAFVVTDSGKGITAEQATTLFEPFSQADASTKRKYGGTGLGLVLAKRLAVLLGGDVQLTASTPGKGSTFTVTIDPGEVSFPHEAKLDELGRIAKPKSTAGDASIRLDGMKVLLVDDSLDNRTLVGRLLKLAGVDVETAENGRDGVEKALKKPYDVVLMDIQMPDVDGIEATIALRNEGYKAPIVALTAHAFKAERERCLAVGFNDHISKPIDRAALLKALSRYPASSTKSPQPTLH